jgi:DNA-binding CsgD family transcriptional regulator
MSPSADVGAAAIRTGMSESKALTGRPSVTTSGAPMPAGPVTGNLPPNSAEILREVTGIAATPGTVVERAEAVLAHLQRVVRSDAGLIALLPVDRDAHVPLARSGYDERVRGYLDSPAMRHELELIGLHRSRRPMGRPDLPVPLSELPGWAEYMDPAGFRDGVTAGLFTSENRYLGLVTVHTRTAGRVSEVARDLIGLLATPIAAAVDPLRSLATIAGIVQQATAGIVLAPSGAVLPLPGLPDHRLLAPGSAVLTAACAQLGQGGEHAAFLTPLPAPEDADGGQPHVRITVLAAPPDLWPFAAAVVLLSPAPDLHGLSRRELQVLGWLVTGASNQAIAAGLGITARTVEVHVDHLRAKLAAPSRTAAAARALRLGLFVPPPLLGSRA